MMTSFDAFTALKALIVDNAELMEFVDNELAKLNARKEEKKEKQALNEKLMNDIIDVLAIVEDEEDGLPTAGIAKEVGISSQKATYLLRELVNKGEVIATKIKDRNYYKLAS